MKQRCVSNNFIVNNDNLEVDARVSSDKQNGEESKIAERQRESVCERQCITERKDSIGHKTGQLEETFGDGHM